MALFTESPFYPEVIEIDDDIETNDPNPKFSYLDSEGQVQPLRIATDVGHNSLRSSPLSSTGSIYSVNTEANGSTLSSVSSLSSINGRKDSNDTESSSSSSDQWLQVPGQKRRNASDTFKPGHKRRLGIFCHSEGCDESFTRPSDLKRHINYKHTRKLPGCGCCKNQSCEVKRLRLDKLKERCNRYHHWPKNQRLFTCEELKCGGLYFVSESCLGLQTKNDHSSNDSVVSSIRSPQVSDLAFNCGCLQAAELANARCDNPMNSIPYANGSDDHELLSSTLIDAPFSQSYFGSEPSIDPQFCWPVNLTEEPSVLHWSGMPISRIFKFPGLEHMSFPSPIISQDLQALHPPIPRTNSVPNHYDGKSIAEKSIAKVQPIEFAILSAQGLFADIRDILDHDVCILDLRFVTYDVKAKRVILRGARERLPQAIELFEKVYKLRRNTQKNILQANPNITESRDSGPPRLYDCNTALSTFPSRGKNMKTFAFNARDHPDHYETWMEILMPELPDILDKVLGGLGLKYSASLIKLGEQRRDAKPYIQIETDEPFRESTKTLIRKRIDEICCAHSRPLIRISFALGAYVNLAHHEYTDFQGIDNNEYYFSYHSPWLCPSMGAPIGMKCSDRVSGTLGGFLQIDGEKYVVTAAHVVEHAREPKHLKERLEETDIYALESPPHSIVQSLHGWLDRTEKELQGAVEEEMAVRAQDNQEITPEELSGELTQDLQKSQQARQILQQGPQVIGHYTTSKDTLKESNTLRRRKLKRKLGPRDKVRMDWAVHKALTRGSNKHRYQSAEKARTAYPQADPLDEGQICDETCDPGSDDDVHYVGRGSGHRKLKVNSAPSCVYDGKFTFCAHFILDAGRSVNAPEAEGDSGAWIIRSSDNKALGQLYDAVNGKLLFTPINDIIDHIKEELQVTDVHLPRSSDQPATPLAEVQCLSCIRPPLTVPSLLNAMPPTPPLTPDPFCANAAPQPKPSGPIALNPRPDSAGPLTPSPVELESACDIIGTDTGAFSDVGEIVDKEAIHAHAPPHAETKTQPCSDLTTSYQRDENALKGVASLKASSKLDIQYRPESSKSSFATAACYERQAFD